MKDQESLDESLFLESLTSSEALKRLLFEIEFAQHEHVRNQSPTLWELIYESFYPNSLYPITAILWNLILSILLYSEDHPIGGTFILFSVFFNITLTLNETRLKKTEIRRRLLFVAGRLRSLQENGWAPPNYPHLHTPMAASIVLQWTLRDGHQVNLPWPLLVKGDVILIKPGQAAPGQSRSCNDSEFILQPGEILHIKTENSSKIFSPTPEFRAPLQPKAFILLETPYMKIVHQFLDADKTFKKPLSLLTKYAHFYFVTLTQHVVVPLLWVILILASLVKRYTYKNEPIFDISSVMIPVLSTVFPLSWLLINMAGVARVLEVFNSSRHLQLHDDDDPFEEPENIQPLRTTSSFPSLKNYFLSALKSSGEFFTRRENIVHTLGSVNALCCTDKKGILSWPNTSAEKVFFLRKDDSKITTEILNVTHDHQNPFKVEFDDPSWVTFLKDLKPIGLSILLNTCNLITEEKYTNFYNHLICESFQKDDLLPIATRGCLCELSRKIGFHRSKTAQDYHLTSQIQVFRHVKLDCHDKFAKNLSLARLKFPFPHMVSVLIQQRSTGTRQLFSQGTSDIILDSCIDFWSGKDLEPLTEDARKKILDFYQRASLSSYCTAFSYRPLTFGIPWKTVGEYLQLPTHSLPFYVHYSDPVQLCEHETIYNHISLGNADKFISNEDEKENVIHGQDDALKCLEIECNQTFLGMVQLQYQPFVDLVQLIDLLEKACIRFVHFSKENELRSRVFSEKMGLESGWNCHISLKSQNKLDAENKIISYIGPKYHHKRKSESSIKMFRQTILGSSIPEDLSRPSWFLDFPQWKEGAHSVSEDEPHQFRLHSHSADQYSVHSDSSNPFDYDMSNRAKLPKGIENIRPHLQNMDDVPLLVSLFTDCTPATTTEMLVIMQEYGEVVCVLGSSSNHTNASIFLQADGSLGVEPLYPQICQSVPVFTPPKSGEMGPIELAGFLNSIVCSLSFKRKDEVSIFHLLLESRHFVLSLLNTMQFWISSILAVSALHLLVFLLDLPSVLRVNQNLWLNSFFIPTLSLSCMGVPPDASIMNISTGKNILYIDIKYGLWCYGLRFIPSILLITIIHGLAATHLQGKIVLFQEINMIELQIYLILISHSYLFRSYQTWQRFYCRAWCIITFLLLLIQVITLIVVVLVQEGIGNLNIVPPYVWGLSLSSFPIILLINEMVKRQEIKINVRYQKRARLEFGTKLGINSPF